MPQSPKIYSCVVHGYGFVLILFVQFSRSFRGENHQFTLNLDVVDKTKTKDIFNCEEYLETSEDDCLNECLAKTFYEEFQCLHPRLKSMNLKNSTLKNQKSCLIQDLKNKTEVYAKEMNKGKLVGYKSVEEFGLVRIKQILAKFNHENIEEFRCGCPFKCKRSVITINKWPKEMKMSYLSYAKYQVKPQSINFQTM